jgi:hypothetical protein
MTTVLVPAKTKSLVSKQAKAHRTKASDLETTGARGTRFKVLRAMEPSIEPGLDSAITGAIRMKPRLTWNFGSEGTK